MENDFLSGFIAGQSDTNGGGDMFGGGGWGGLLGLIVVASLFGLGRNGSPFGGGGGGGVDLSGVATRADINAGFQFNDLQNGIRGIERGLCDGFYSVQNGLNTIGHQISDCCCATQRAIDSVNFNILTQTNALQNTMCSNTRDIIENQNNGTRAILDFMVQEKLSAKDARIAQLENKVALSEQSALFNAKLDSVAAELLRRTGHDYPVGAYLVQAPTPINFPTNGCGTVQFGCNGCGYGNYAA